jgi:hypothetical protein
MKQYYFDLAIKIAKYNDDRTYCLGSVGIRTDGVLVCSRNGNSFSTKTNKFSKDIRSHAEGRILRKLNIGSTIYIARIKKEDDSIAIAKPCKNCSCMIKAKKIDKVYYTIDSSTYGLWLPKTNKYFVFDY